MRVILVWVVLGFAGLQSACAQEWVKAYREAETLAETVMLADAD